MKTREEYDAERAVLGPQPKNPSDGWEREVTMDENGVYHSKPRKTFAELRERMSPEAQERAAARTTQMLSEIDTNKMRHELENIYMLARLKRAIVYRYPEGFPDVPAEPIGPKSDDADWDHVIRFCEQAGLRPTVLRTTEQHST